LTEVRISTIPERMMYDVSDVTIKPGKKVKLTFANVDFMPHNILLVRPGKADEVGLKAIALGARGFDVGFVPESDDILWSSRLVDHGDEQVIEFTAPTTEGAYPYICSFPGHHLIMRGTLFVTDDLKDFLAKNPEPVPTMTEWKPGDLEADLNRVAQHRSFARGKQLFTTLACSQCHQLGKDGVDVSRNLTIGPNLEDVLKKHRGEARPILLEILEPSRNVEEKYRKVLLELRDGTTIAGNVIAEDEASLTIFAGPPPAKEQKVAKSAIESRQLSPLSIMPVGLLNSLDKEQILDLLAYVLAGGNADHAAFKHAH
jgi:putative heme-binding domain-containing protein